jgi:hypothetical protein
MLEFLAAWAGEIILGLAATAITIYFKKQINKLEVELEKAKKFDESQEKDAICRLIDQRISPLKAEHIQIDQHVDVRIQELYKELENIRAFERKTRIDSDELKKVLIDSWKYRLQELCEVYLKRGSITVDEFRQLQEFYGYYTALGGNGIIKTLFDKIKDLPN